MGMYNAIIDDELLNPLGVFKERLSQSALVARMRTVGDARSATLSGNGSMQKGMQIQHRQG